MSAGQIHQDVYCSKCGEYCAIQTIMTERVIWGVYLEGFDGQKYCKKCFGIVDDSNKKS